MGNGHGDGNLLKIGASDIGVKGIPVNQGLGVLSFGSAFLGSKSVIMLRYSIAVCQDVKAFFVYSALVFELVDVDFQNSQFIHKP